MQLPEQLEMMRDEKVWVCYPMIWNDEKHSGVGGFDKPPVNPHTLYNGSTNNLDSLATYDEAVSQIGQIAHVRINNHDSMINSRIVGVGIALSGTGIIGIDMDNVVDNERRVMTREADEIVKMLSSYTEVSPSGTGLHILFLGELPDGIKKIVKQKPDIFHTAKAEYQFFDSGYMTISADMIGNYEIAERSTQAAEVHSAYFEEVEPISRLSTRKPKRTSFELGKTETANAFSRERWMKEIRGLSESEILERIFKSGSLGIKIKKLYSGDTSEYYNDHSRADQALVTYLYGFTEDRGLTERLFRASALFRATGKSRSYIDRTLDKASTNCIKLVGHIDLTDAEKRAFTRKNGKNY